MFMNAKAEYLVVCASREGTSQAKRRTAHKAISPGFVYARACVPPARAIVRRRRAGYGKRARGGQRARGSVRAGQCAKRRFEAQMDQFRSKEGHTCGWARASRQGAPLRAQFAHFGVLSARGSLWAPTLPLPGQNLSSSACERVSQYRICSICSDIRTGGRRRQRRAGAAQSDHMRHAPGLPGAACAASHTGVQRQCAFRARRFRGSAWAAPPGDAFVMVCTAALGRRVYSIVVVALSCDTADLL